MFEFTSLSYAMRRVLMARERIARRTTFFASILFNAKLVESTKHQTIWTDGINVYFNPDYVTQNDEFIEGDILEVVMHCAMQHIDRRKHRELDRWNEASDLSIRPLVHQFFRQHPELHQKDGLYPDKAAEEIYELLEEQGSQKPPPGGGAKSEGAGQDKSEQPGGMMEPEEGQEEAAEEAAKQWSRATANAVDKATKAGNMPGNIKRLIEQLIPADKLDWRDLARDMSRDAKSKTSRSWSRVNRRHNGHDGNPPMPGYADDNIYNLIICFDVSGSVDDDMLKDMKSEAAALIDQDLVNQATLIAVDTSPRDVEVVTNSEGVLNWTPHGGGGTDFRSAMALIKEEYGNSVGMIFLTDMETMSFGEEPPFPCVWVNFAPANNKKAPFGRTVEY